MVAALVGKSTQLIKGYSTVFGVETPASLPAALWPQDVLEEKHLQNLQRSCRLVQSLHIIQQPSRGEELQKVFLSSPYVEGKSVAVLFFLEVSVFGKMLITMLRAQQHIGHLLPCRVLSNTKASWRKKKVLKNNFYVVPPPPSIIIFLYSLTFEPTLVVAGFLLL